jgi:signal transduction histidine kinase
MSLDMLVREFDQLEPTSLLRLIRRAQRSASWLQSLTENLTSVAAVEAGHLEVRPRTMDVRECVEDAILLVHSLLEQRGQSIRFTCAAASTLVHADPARVVQVIANLLTNASRYSVEGDVIELHLSASSQHVRVRVTDHGPGISPEDQQRIFGAWVRGESSTPGGLGLGLSIVQNLIQRHGGRVGVDSAVGQGASFWFTLPTGDASTCLA